VVVAGHRPNPRLSHRTGAGGTVRSGPARKFVGGSDPARWVAQVEAAGGVQGVLGGAGGEAGG
jgi:hypothetical protein